MVIFDFRNQFHQITTIQMFKIHVILVECVVFTSTKERQKKGKLIYLNIAGIN